jgi:hypothetical protein
VLEKLESQCGSSEKCINMMNILGFDFTEINQEEERHDITRSTESNGLFIRLVDGDQEDEGDDDDEDDDDDDDADETRSQVDDY